MTRKNAQEECPETLCLHMRGSIRDTNVIERNPVAIDQILDRDPDEFIVPSESDHASFVAFMNGEEISCAASESADDDDREDGLAAIEDDETLEEYLDRMRALAPLPPVVASTETAPNGLPLVTTDGEVIGMCRVAASVDTSARRSTTSWKDAAAVPRQFKRHAR